MWHYSNENVTNPLGNVNVNDLMKQWNKIVLTLPIKLVHLDKSDFSRLSLLFPDHIDDTLILKGIWF